MLRQQNLFRFYRPRALDARGQKFGRTRRGAVTSITTSIIRMIRAMRNGQSLSCICRPCSASNGARSSMCSQPGASGDCCWRTFRRRAQCKNISSSGTARAVVELHALVPFAKQFDESVPQSLSGNVDDSCRSTSPVPGPRRLSAILPMSSRTAIPPWRTAPLHLLALTDVALRRSKPSAIEPIASSIVMRAVDRQFSGVEDEWRRRSPVDLHDPKRPSQRFCLLSQCACHCSIGSRRCCEHRL